MEHNKTHQNNQVINIGTAGASVSLGQGGGNVSIGNNFGQRIENPSIVSQMISAIKKLFRLIR